MRERQKIWQDDAACNGWGAEIFFPEQTSGWKRRIEVSPEVQRLCGGCPVRLRCLEWALTVPEKHGIWAATTPQQRESMKRRRTRATCPTCASRQLRKLTQMQVCTTCGASWLAQRPPAVSGHRRRAA